MTVERPIFDINEFANSLPEGKVVQNMIIWKDGIIPASKLAKVQSGEILDIERDSIPLNWYIGYGRQDDGIKSIGMNAAFEELEEGQVELHYQQWSHFTGNAHPPDSPNYQVAQQAINNAETYITQVTGFSPAEIKDTQLRLTKEYRHKQEAPIEFELF